MNWKKDVNKLPSAAQIIKKVKQLKEIESEIVLQCVCLDFQKKLRNLPILHTKKKQEDQEKVGVCTGLKQTVHS